MQRRVAFVAMYSIGGNGRPGVYRNEGDYAAFLGLMAEAKQRPPLRSLG